MRRLVLLVLVLVAIASGLALFLRGTGEADFDQRFDRADQKLETLAEEIEADLDEERLRR